MRTYQTLYPDPPSDRLTRPLTRTPPLSATLVEAQGSWQAFPAVSGKLPEE